MTNKELNLVHRVFTDDDAPTDAAAAERVEYLREESYRRELASEGAAPDLFATPSPRDPVDHLPVQGLFDDRVSGSERRRLE